MMKIHEIRELIKLVDQSSIEELELENDGVHITLKKAQLEVEETAHFPTSPAILGDDYQQAAVTMEILEPAVQIDNPTPAIATVPVSLTEIKSDWVGVFASSPKPGVESYVKLGDKVKAGQVVCRCHVDILKLSHDIASPINGEIVDLLVHDGQFVDYGQPLFVVRAD